MIKLHHRFDERRLAVRSGQKIRNIRVIRGFRSVFECSEMKHIATGRLRKKFALLAGSRECQAMKMVLPPGGVTDERPSNEHRHSEQWLFVVAGSGVATIGRRRSALRRVRLREHSLLLIEKGELHQIKNTGRRQLVTVNFYVPPAYNSKGDPL
jgi:mannose-6-phosphate isomerase-like protein (cupin superfamily)